MSNPRARWTVACETVTVAGFPLAPLADTRIVPERGPPLLVAYAAVIVPVLPPDEPELIESHDEPLVTAAE
jgi:hypothetical protein